MRNVKPKKSLGQHFLTDKNIASKIVNSLSYNGYSNLLEIGPGTGILTNELIKKKINLKVIQIDDESVEYLRNNLNKLSNTIGHIQKNLYSIYKSVLLIILQNCLYLEG